jgi:hypothetical protein
MGCMSNCIRGRTCLQVRSVQENWPYLERRRRRELWAKIHPDELISELPVIADDDPDQEVT